MNNREDYLEHFGVKGMRWGVRRYEDKHGKLTILGKKRYSKDNTSSKKQKSEHRKRLENAYYKNGLSKKEAEKAADNRIKTEKILAAAAGVTVAVAVAYVAHKKLAPRINGVIRAGSSLQRIEMQNTNGGLHEVFYAAKGHHDKKRYRNKLSALRQRQTGEAYIMKLRAKKNIKVASQHNAFKAYNKLYNEDAKFREIVNPYLQHVPGNLRNKKSGYEQFNVALVDFNGNDHAKYAADRFYNELKSKGYGAIQDVNDMKFSGYHAKNPLIIFDNKDNGNIMVESFKKINKDMKRNAQREDGKIFIESLNDAMNLDIKALGLASVGTVGTAAYYRSTEPTVIDEQHKK